MAECQPIAAVPYNFQVRLPVEAVPGNVADDDSLLSVANGHYTTTFPRRFGFSHTFAGDTFCRRC